MPIYQNYVKYGYRERVYYNYQSAKDFYHPIVREMVQKLALQSSMPEKD